MALQKSDKEILKYFSQFVNEGVLRIPEEVFLKMEKEYGPFLDTYLEEAKLFELPEFEKDFFKWLKAEDPRIWTDLWAKDEEDYLVSTVFLPMLLEKDGRGFPICDLLHNDNYYFAPAHMVDEESKIMIETAKTRFKNKEPITTAQLLALEISYGGIDIWHFAYKHKIELQEAKKAAHSLIEDNALVHLKEAEHLAPLLEF